MKTFIDTTLNRSPWLLIFALFISFVVHSAADPVDDTSPLPLPPMQGKPWTPPATNLPPLVVSATRQLFAQGMADPRGCEYRKVEIAAASPSDENANTKVHAWVLPGGRKTRYAIGWNGLVYPVAKMGGLVDLQKDFPIGSGGQAEFRTAWGSYESIFISEKWPAPIKVAILLRLGETKLAEKAWSDGCNGDQDAAKQDPYAAMAQTWLDAWYLRGLAAHTTGNDPLALQLFRSLPPLEKAVRATAAKRGLPEKQANGARYLDELRQLPDLITDQERRAKEPPREPVLASGTPSAGPAYIAALINDLEFVHGVEFMSPGDNNPFTDPIVQTLARQGEPAVEPLIACLEENPPRMTRTVYSYRGRFQGPVIYVYEPVCAILNTILHTTISVPVSSEQSRHEMTLNERKELAAKFRAYWSKYKDTPMTERWFSVLNDDSASPADWFLAITNIMQPSDTFLSGPSPFSNGGMGSLGPGNAGRRGDPLRAKTNPSVSDLIIKRFNQLLPLAKVTENTYPAVADPAADQKVTYKDISDLLLDLADWDGKARMDDVKDLARKLNAKFPSVSENFTYSTQVNAELFEKRYALGDPSALKDYADWVAKLPPKTGLTSTVLSLMESHPDDPAIRDLSARMFQDKKSPWRPSSPAELRKFKDLATTRMLGVPAFREELLAILDDTTVMGFTRTLATGELEVQMNDERDYADKERAALPRMDFRVCDYYASVLQDVWEFPSFHPAQPQAQRDTDIAAFKKFLAQYGSDYQLTSDSFPGDAPEVRLTFPKLDHPGTADDVAQGRAIFSLAGETRLCPMPKFPLYARRAGYKETPDSGPDQRLDKTSWVTDDAADGLVWQAEEVKIDGKWQRFYGFAGRHRLEKVPAEEIEFPGGGAPLTPQINGIAEFKIEKRPGGFLPPPFIVAPGAPLPLVIKACNHTGLDQQVPAGFIQAANAGKALPGGITLSLTYSEKIPPELGKDGFDVFFTRPVEFDYGTWKEIPPRKEIPAAPADTAAANVGPAAEIELAQIDLRDYFDAQAPGTYRLRTVFHPPGQQAPAASELTFTIKENAN